MKKTAAYFEVGDMILYGKYKNKKGRILRFDQDKKGNPQVVIEPVPKGRKQNKTMGLFKIWKQQDQEKTAARVAERYAATVTRKLGTCGFCTKKFRLPNDLLALHGYNRPGYGYVEGECPGSRHVPWEISPVTGEMARDFYQGLVNQYEDALKKLPTQTELRFGRGSYGREVVYKKDEVSEPVWRLHMEDKKRDLESNLKNVSLSFKEYDRAVKSWKPQEVEEFSEAKQEKQRQEKRDAVRMKRMERYEAQKQKLVGRITSSWNNFKKREAKYKSKPTDKNMEALAGNAQNLIDMYTGTVLKLAEAHPDRGYRAFDVLKDLNLDHVWKHLGLMKGSQYVDRKEAEKLDPDLYAAGHGWKKDWKPKWPGWTGPRTAKVVAERYRFRQARYASNLEKLRLRTDRLFDRLLPLEARLQLDGPTQETLQATAKVASQLFEIFTDAPTRLSQNHPAHVARDQVLVDLGMDHVWSHLGLQVETKYVPAKQARTMQHRCRAGSYDFVYRNAQEWYPFWPGFPWCSKAG